MYLLAAYIVVWYLLALKFMEWHWQCDNVLKTLCSNILITVATQVFLPIMLDEPSYVGPRVLQSRDLGKLQHLLLLTQLCYSLLSSS